MKACSQRHITAVIRSIDKEAQMNTELANEGWSAARAVRVGGRGKAMVANKEID
jgi:nitrogen regulatory protein PII